MPTGQKINNLVQAWKNVEPRNQLIIFCMIASLLFIVLPLLLFTGSMVYSATISLTYAPKDAVVKIGDSTGKFGDNKVLPGTYKVTITMQGFDSFERSVTVKRGETVTIEAVLQSNDPSTANWYRDNISDYTIAQTIGDTEADRSYMKMVTQYPIVKALPIDGLYGTYEVNYGPSPSNKEKYAVFISYQSDADKRAAEDAVAKAGFRLSDYEVIYKQTIPKSVNGVVITDTARLSARGISASRVEVIVNSLTKYFSAGQSFKVDTISIGNNLTHVISEDKLTDTYVVDIYLNSTQERQMIITVTDYNNVTIQVGMPSGASRITIYTGRGW